MSDNSTSNTFWKLVKSCKITIPQLQRDYAQGRDGDDSIKQIRTSLVEDLYESLTQNTPLVLNFIYGEKTEDRFIPIDGQQRLTTLFLLCWYIFSQASYKEGLEVLTRFSYMTRNTSKRFCDNICSTQMDFSLNNISGQLRDNYWFTGNFYNDPTVKSMLVMLDTIHERFRKNDKYIELKERLISDDCPISFLWLPMENFQKTDDLYIKMNARGKLLTDFEIFKAKLQNSQLLERVLENECSEKEKMLYISKYNNQYAEFFYQYFVDDFDSALMDFIKAIIRDDYFCYVSEVGVGQKDYRDDYKQIQKMNGSVFFRFIEKNGFEYERCKNASDTLTNSIKKLGKLLMMFCRQDTLKIQNSLSDLYYDEEELFKRNRINPTFSDNVVRYALYAYIEKFEYPDTSEKVEAYSMWMRFVYNIVENSEFKGLAEYICEAMVLLKRILGNIVQSRETSVLSAIAHSDLSKSTAAMQYQHREEIIKAKLIISENEWRKAILEAEEYFSDGQIGFLLDFCYDTDTSLFNIVKFNQYFSVAKQLFKGNKTLIDICDYRLVEKAMLCMPDPTSKKTAHLEKKNNSTTSWGFYGKDYKRLLSNEMDENKRSIVKSLFDAIDGAQDINQILNQIISNINLDLFDSESEWKKPFIENDLWGIDMGYYPFKNCVHLSCDNTEILLLAGTTVRAYSMEINTYLLFKRLVAEKVIGLRLKLETTAQLLDADNFPMRYIEYKNIMVGYSVLKADPQKSFVCKDASIVIRMSIDEVVTKIKSI